MLNSRLFVLPVLAAALLAAAPARAATLQVIGSRAPLNHIDVETDPSAFFLQGYSLWVGIKPAATLHWRFGLGSFAATLPSFLTPSGWSVHDTGYFAAAHYFFSEEHQGWYVGGFAGYLQSTYSNAGVAGQTATINHLALFPSVGYQWFPWGSGFYVQPWVGLGLSFPLGGQTTLGGQSVPDPMFVPQPAIHLGWEF